MNGDACGARGQRRDIRGSPSTVGTNFGSKLFSFCPAFCLLCSDLLTSDVLLSTLLSSPDKKKSEKPRFSIGSTQRHGCCRPVVPKRNDRSLRSRTFMLCAGPGASWTTSIATGARVGSSGRTIDAIYTRAGPAHHRTQTSKPLARASMRKREPRIRLSHPSGQAHSLR